MIFWNSENDDFSEFQKMMIFWNYEKWRFWWNSEKWRFWWNSENHLFDDFILCFVFWSFFDQPIWDFWWNLMILMKFDDFDEIWCDDDFCVFNSGIDAKMAPFLPKNGQIFKVVFSNKYSTKNDQNWPFFVKNERLFYLQIHS